MAPTRCWRRCSGRWSSDAGGLPTSGPSWPPAAPPPPPGRPPTRCSFPNPPFRPTPPPALAADLAEGLKRLKMAAMRRLAPELLITAKTQRWSPEELLRTLVEAGGAARDASNARTRRRQAMFPVTKTLEEFDLAASSVPPATFDYLASLEWIQAAENLCLIGPAGTGKSHLLLALGSAAVDAGHRSATTAPRTWSTPSTAASP